MLDGISEKVLTEQLRQLETDGIVQRTEFDGKLLHVEYDLSATGRALVPALVQLSSWGQSHIERVTGSENGLVCGAPVRLRIDPDDPLGSVLRQAD